MLSQDVAKIKLKNYTAIKENPSQNLNSVILFIRNDISFSTLPLNTNLHALACKIRLQRTFTICCLYLSPSQNIQPNQLNDLYDQLPQPSIITGDFNAHNPLWGSKDTNARGKMIENWMLNNNLCILNTGSNTFLSSMHGTFSAIDLSFCDPQLTPITHWSVEDDTFGSDHFPITIKWDTTNPPTTKRKKFNDKFADWEKFQLLADLSHIKLDTDINTVISELHETIIKAAQETIPKTSGKPRNKNVPWWNAEVAAAVYQRKRALKTFKQFPTTENFINFKKLRAQARRTINSAKNISWTKYVETITPQTTSREIWTKIKTLNAIYQSSEISCIQINNVLNHDPDVIVNTLAKTFAETSASSTYPSRFIAKKTNEEANFQPPIQLQMPNIDPINLPFTKTELCAVLRKGKGKSTGPNEISYNMLKHINSSSLGKILEVFNKIWTEESFPTTWTQSYIIPIKKKDSNQLNPLSYRPISLTNCDCKLMERLVNERLIWILETKNRICQQQAGFRKFRNTTDNLLILQTDILKAFEKRAHVFCVFFDLHKAYERIWRLSIIKQIIDWGITGRLLSFIINFLNKRSFRVLMGGYISQEYNLENGLPQGSVLSVTLFLIGINKIVEIFTDKRIKFLLFADDLVIYILGLDTNEMINILNNILRKLEDWAQNYGFTFSTIKTKWMHFCNRRNCATPNLQFSGNPIELVNAHKFLGLTFTSKLKWNNHIRHIKEKCKKDLNIIRTLCGVTWGSHRKPLLRVLEMLILSKIDYASEIYSSAPNSQLKTLDVILNTGLRQIIGAFKSSPITSILADSGFLDLQTRREKRCLSYAAKINSTTTNSLVHKSLSYSNHKNSFAHRINQYLYKYNIDLSNTIKKQFPSNPKWLLSQENIIFTLSTEPKANIHPKELQTRFKIYIEDAKYTNDKIIYTDASKIANNTGYAAVLNNHTIISKKTRDMISINTAETKAVYEAICYIQQTDMSNILICTDSMSTLMALSNLNNNDPLINMIRDKLIELQSTKIMWVPGHVGISGNELADTSAKAASEHPIIEDNLITPRDINKHIKTTIQNFWEQNWNSITNNKMRDIKNTPFAWDSSNRKNRRESVVITRLRIGHTKTTHGHLMNNTIPEICIPCNSSITVKHLLSDCPKYQTHRSANTIPNTLPEILKDDVKSMDNLIKFLKDIKLYEKI